MAWMLSAVMVMSVIRALGGAADVACLTNPTPGPLLREGGGGDVSSSWNAVFERTEGWTGGDGGSTVSLRDGRVMWLFGDSVIGPVKNGVRSGAVMVNNAISVHPVTASGAAPSPKDVVYRWREDANKKAQAWGVLPEVGDPARWLWPAGGGWVSKLEDGSTRLVVFYMMQRRKDASDSMWNFQLCGTAVGVVEHAERGVAEWSPRVTPIIEAKAEENRLVTWGAVVIEDRGFTSGAKRVLIYGADVTDTRHKRVTLARAPEATMDRLETWEYWDGAAWSSDRTKAAGIADGAVDEFSVFWVEGRYGLNTTSDPKLIMTQMEPDLGRRILMRVADRPEGPWTKGEVVYACPEPIDDKRLMVYSGKSHDEVGRGGAERALLVSYCVNSSDFWHAAGEGWVYRPRCVWISEDKVQEAARGVTGPK